MIKFKKDIMAELKKMGWNTTRIQKEKLLSQGTYASIIKGNANINMDSLNKICVILKCQPGDILEEVVLDEEKIKYY